MAEKNFPIKGFKEGLLISIDEGSWKENQLVLLKQIDERPDFYKGAKIAIDVGERSLRAAEMGALRDQLCERNVHLFAVISKSSVTEAVAESLGLSTHKSVLKEQSDIIRNALMQGEKAILIRKTLRSGTSVKHPGHVIIFGDVNPGAEIQAGGSIFIWGKLRGSAHAGIDGSEEHIICALELNPSNLRIANIIKDAPKIKIRLKKSRNLPQLALIQEGQIRIVDWDKDKNQ